MATTITTNGNGNEQTTRGTLRSLLWVTPLAIAASAAASLALYAAAGALIPTVAAWPGAGPGQIIGATTAYLLIGAVVAVVVARLSGRPARTYRRVATVGLLLSLALPLGALSGATAPGAPPAGLATVVVLSLMHVVAYGVSVAMVERWVWA